MSNSAKAGEEDTWCGLKLRGEVMDTKLMIWWTGNTEPIQDSLQSPKRNRLEVRFSVFMEDPAEAPSVM